MTRFSGAGATLVDTLSHLMELTGPTGQEEPVLAWCRETWAELGAEVTVTPIGNVLAKIRGSGPRLLIEGHADEIGFVVKSIDARGFLWLADAQAGRRAFHQRFFRWSIRPDRFPDIAGAGPLRVAVRTCAGDKTGIHGQVGRERRFCGHRRGIKGGGGGAGDSRRVRRNLESADPPPGKPHCR